MKKYQKFVVFWIINSLILYFANLLFPQSIAVGNDIFTPLQAVVVSGLIWNLTIWYTEPFLKDLEYPLKNRTAMMLGYLAVNFATLWLIARFAVLTGIGFSSYLHVLGVALIANFVQYLAWQRMDGKK